MEGRATMQSKIQYTQQTMKVDNLQEIQRQLFEVEDLNAKIRSRRYSLLLTLPLFALIEQKKGRDNFKFLIDSVTMTKCELGDVIFEGEEGRRFTYILKGTVLLFSHNKADNAKEPIKLYRRLGPHDYFGEKMTYGKEEIHSARVVGQCFLLQLQMSHFYRGFAGHFKYEELKDKLNFLKAIWVFQQVKRALLQRILLSSQNKKYIRNDCLFKAKSIAEWLWVIMEGEVALMSTKDGLKMPFCFLSKGSVIGAEELSEQREYDYDAVCISGHASLLKIDKEIALGIIERDIESSTLLQRKKVTVELKNTQLDYRKEAQSLHKPVKKKYTQVNPIDIKYKTFQKRYKTEYADPQEPKDRILLLDQLFKKELQLKESKIRNIRLEEIKKRQRESSRKHRLSTISNHQCTYDKEIISKYLDRKDKEHRSAIRQELEFRQRKTTISPFLRVADNTAVRNQKRKLKNSRRQCFSMLQITTDTQ